MRTSPENLVATLGEIPEYIYYGRVTAVLGMLVEIGGVQGQLSIGDRCDVVARGERRVACEVIGFRDGRALLMPFGSLEGVGLGCRTEFAEPKPVVYPNSSWLGRAVNALAEPLDGKGPLPEGVLTVPLRNSPPPPHERQRVGKKEENRLLGCACGLLAAHEDMAEMIRLGAYRKGSDPRDDEAIIANPALEAFFAQERDERCNIESGSARLAQILAGLEEGDGAAPEQEGVAAP